MMAQQAMMPVIGKAVPLLSILTNPELIAPKPICTAPISAEALPACLAKGAMHNADEFGKVKPWQLKNSSNSKIVPVRPMQAVSEPAKRLMPARLCINKATGIICSLL